MSACVPMNQQERERSMKHVTTESIAQLLNLTGKGAIVTGGAVGIGQAIALRLAEAGANVMIADIDLAAAMQTVEQIESTGGKARAVRSDVSIAADANKLVQATVEAFGRLDILVNNAGIYPLSPALKISEEGWDRVLDINLKGMFFYSQAAAQQMIKAGQGGKIINIASEASLHSAGDHAHYDASKGGVVMLTKSLALELAPHRILVNAVAPGFVTTPGTKAQSDAYLAEGRDTNEMTRNFKARLPLQRAGRPDDIAKVVLFLSGSGADYIIGTMLLVDGGHLLT